MKIYKNIDYGEKFIPNIYKIKNKNGYEKYSETIAFLKESLSLHFNFIINNQNLININPVSLLILETGQGSIDSLVSSMLNLSNYENSFREIFIIFLIYDNDILFTFSKIALTLEDVDFKNLILLIASIDIFHKISKSINNYEYNQIINEEIKLIHKDIQELMTFGWYYGEEIKIKRFEDFENPIYLEEDFDICEYIKQYSYFKFLIS